MIFGQNLFASITFATPTLPEAELPTFYEWIELIPSFTRWDNLDKAASSFAPLQKEISIWDEQPKTPGRITRWEDYAT